MGGDTINKEQKEVQQAFLDSEKEVLERLKKNYQDALNDINKKIEQLLARQDADMQHVIYQVEYQKTLKKQVQSILEQLQVNEFETVSEYLTQSYTNGYIGTMYDIAGQGIPLILPIDQEQVVAALQNETNLSTTLYDAFDIKDLQKKISGEISRGISTGMMYSDISRNISNYANISRNNAMRIARTEGHRIQCKAASDAQWKAKSRGADIVKQWDATLDGKTRASHKKVDGEIRELGENRKDEEPFSNGLMFPGDPKGDASEVINCRCALLQRARWALDEDELETLKKRAEYFGLDKTDNFDDYKKKYLKAVEYEGGIPKRWKTVDTTKDDAIKNANPKYGTGVEYSKNCPNCAVAYEMRKRGYNVTASPYTKGGSHYLNKYPWEAWEGADVQTITNKKDLFLCAKKYGDGARFAIAIQYSDNSGHVIVGEVVEDVLKLYDVQEGKSILNIDFDDINDVKLWQTNNLGLSDRGITACEGR